MKLNTCQILEMFVEQLFRRAKDRDMVARNIEIFYLRTFKEITLRELGEEFDLNHERIRQIECKMQRVFRKFLENKNLEI